MSFISHLQRLTYFPGCTPYPGRCHKPKLKPPYDSPLTPYVIIVSSTIILCLQCEYPTNSTRIISLRNVCPHVLPPLNVPYSFLGFQFLSVFDNEEDHFPYSLCQGSWVSVNVRGRTRHSLGLSFSDSLLEQEGRDQRTATESNLLRLVFGPSSLGSTTLRISSRRVRFLHLFFFFSFSSYTGTSCFPSLDTYQNSRGSLVYVISSSLSCFTPTCLLFSLYKGGTHVSLFFLGVKSSGERTGKPQVGRERRTSGWGLGDVET